jgi:hypothetical protein
MTKPVYPGVYVEEVPSHVKSIPGAPTSSASGSESHIDEIERLAPKVLADADRKNWPINDEDPDQSPGDNDVATELVEMTQEEGWRLPKE